MKLTILVPLAGLGVLAMGSAALGGVEFAGAPLGPGFPDVIDIFPINFVPPVDGEPGEEFPSHTILPGPVVLGTVVLLETLFVPPDPFNHALWSDVVNFQVNAQGQFEAEMWSDVEGAPFNPPVNLANLFFVLESPTEQFTIYPVPGLQYHIWSDPVPSPGSAGAMLFGFGALALRRRR